jgi:hypothetical protein
MRCDRAIHKTEARQAVDQENGPAAAHAHRAATTIGAPRAQGPANAKVRARVAGAATPAAITTTTIDLPAKASKRVEWVQPSLSGRITPRRALGGALSQPIRVRRHWGAGARVLCACRLAAIGQPAHITLGDGGGTVMCGRHPAGVLDCAEVAMPLRLKCAGVKPNPRRRPRAASHVSNQ